VTREYRMLIYGDVEHTESASAVRASIARMMIACLEMPSGLKRHETLVQAFTLTGELVQGLADQEFWKTGADHMSEPQDAGAKLLLMQAREIMRSWRNLFDGIISFPQDWAAKLDLLDSADPLRMKHAEGYAFYALYPESYIEAASMSNLPPETVVIGIRSIGTSLAALVSATLGAKPAYTLLSDMCKLHRLIPGSSFPKPKPILRSSMRGRGCREAPLAALEIGCRPTVWRPSGCIFFQVTQASRVRMQASRIATVGKIGHATSSASTILLSGSKTQNVVCTAGRPTLSEFANRHGETCLAERGAPLGTAILRYGRRAIHVTASSWRNG
jgi:hypothetical protein